MNKFKEKNGLQKFVDLLRTYREALGDVKFYKKNSMLRNNTAKNYEYQMMLRLHGIEKGFCMPDKRPFGQQKIKVLIDIMKKAKAAGEITTGYKMAAGIVVKWCEEFEQHGWDNDPTYVDIKKQIDELTADGYIEGGDIDITLDYLEKFRHADFSDFSSSRHSIRQFDEKRISHSDMEESIKLAIKTPSACNRQMCKVYVVEKPEHRKVIEDIGLGLSGFNLNNNNYFVITYDMRAFSFYGERNQGLFNAGLFTMNFIYALHYKGIGSCCLQFGKTNSVEKQVKADLGIAQNEKIAIILAAGYYKDHNILPTSARRNVNEVFTII